MNTATALLLTPATCNGVPDGNGGFTIPLTADCAGGTAPSVTSQIAGGMFGQWVQDFANWLQSAMADVATAVSSFWTSTPTVSIGDQTGQASDTVQWMQDSLRGYTAIIAVISLVLGGVILAFKGRVTLSQLGLFVARLAIAGVLITAVCAVLIAAADQFSEWVIPAASGGTDLGANLALIFANPVNNPVGFVCLVIEFLSSLFLVAMMWLRSAMLVLLVGTVGIAAAMWTPSYFARQVKLIIAVILVKPIAALVFAVGFRLMGSNIAAQGVTELIVGAVILLTSCWSWKFLVKVIAPYDDPMPQTGLGGAIARTAGLVALIAK